MSGNTIIVSPQQNISRNLNPSLSVRLEPSLPFPWLLEMQIDTLLSGLQKVTESERFSLCKGLRKNSSQQMACFLILSSWPWIHADNGLMWN